MSSVCEPVLRSMASTIILWNVWHFCNTHLSSCLAACLSESESEQPPHPVTWCRVEVEDKSGATSTSSLAATVLPSFVLSAPGPLVEAVLQGEWPALACLKPQSSRSPLLKMPVSVSQYSQSWRFSGLVRASRRVQGPGLPLVAESPGVMKGWIEKGDVTVLDASASCSDSDLCLYVTEPTSAR